MSSSAFSIDDELRTLGRLQRCLPALGEAIGELGASQPATGAAEDRTGTVRVTFDDEGVPTAIEVGEGWRRAVGSEGLAAAVEEASRGAAAAAPTGSAQLRLDQLRAYVDGDDPALPPGVPADDGGMFRPAAGVPRYLPDLVDQIRATLRSFSGPAAEDPPPPSEGYAAFGKVTIELRGFAPLTCTVDPQWAAEQQAAELTDALNRALGQAREQLRRVEVEVSASPTVSRLLADLIATLGQPDASPLGEGR